MVPAPSVSVSGVTVPGPVAVIVAVLGAVPDVRAVAVMTMLPRSLLAPAPLPETSVAVTVCPETTTFQPGALTPMLP